MRHLQATIREDFCDIITRPGKEKVAYEDFAHEARILCKRKFEQEEKRANRGKVLPKLTGEELAAQQEAAKMQIRRNADLLLVDQVKEHIFKKEPNNPRYEGYRAMLRDLDEDAMDDLMDYIFSASSKTRLDANFFAHSFLPDVSLYQMAIDKYSPENEKKPALASLIAVETFNSLAKRGMTSKKNAGQVPQSGAAIAGREALEDIYAAPVAASPVSPGVPNTIVAPAATGAPNTSPAPTAPRTSIAPAAPGAPGIPTVVAPSYASSVGRNTSNTVRDKPQSPLNSQRNIGASGSRPPTSPSPSNTSRKSNSNKSARGPRT